MFSHPQLQPGGVKVLDQDPRMATGGGGGGGSMAAAGTEVAGNGPSPRGTPRSRTQLAPGGLRDISGFAERHPGCAWLRFG